MKRLLLKTTTVSAMLALAAPGVASAHHLAERQHHHARHASAHHRHATRATVRTFGSAPATGQATTTTPPATPPSASGETAGTVTSFTGGVLTITLTNGSTVSGQVTDQTEIRCLPSAPPAEGEDQGDDHSGGDQQHPGGGNQGDDNGQGDDGPGDGQSCTTAALVAGAVVREAQLRVSSAGAVWDQVALIG
jgi:hypothetical protein